MVDKKLKILDFFKNNKLAVITTCFEDVPEAAVIDFSETDDFEIIFTTLSSYRKYKNLLKNSKVALVIGGEKNKTLQFEGIAMELNPEEFHKYQDWHVEKNPIEAKFVAMPEARFFKVQPTWIRYSDFSVNEIFEIKF